MMPIHVSHSRTGYIFQLATTLPQLWKDAVYNNFHDLGKTGPDMLPGKWAPFNHPLHPNRLLFFQIVLSLSFSRQVWVRNFCYGN